MSTDTHPSFYELDLLAVGVRTPELDAHVGACEQCRTHMERATSPTPLPSALRERTTDRWAGWRRRWRAWTAGGLVFAAAGFLLTLRPRPPIAQDGIKGNPSVALFVNHDSAISLWDGVTPVRPGDRIQLKVATEGLTHVAVGLIEQGKAMNWLYNGESDSSEGFMLPRSWKVDGVPGAERLTIVLSRESLTPVELDADSRQRVRSADVWTTELMIPKMLEQK